MKITTSTVTVGSFGHVLDASIDWRQRFIWGVACYLGAGTILPLQANTNPFPSTATTALALPMWWTGVTPSASNYTQVTYSGAAQLALQVDGNGALCVAKNGTLVDAVNGDVVAVAIFATDKIRVGI